MNSTTTETISDGHCLYNFSTNETLAYLYSPFSKFFIVIVVPIVGFVGLSGNIAFLFVVYRVKEMRTTTNFYLSNLAVADACVLVNAAIQYLWSYNTSPLDFGTFTLRTPLACLLPNLLIYLCYFASIFLVTFVTGERYLAICHVLKFRISTRRTLILNAITWLLSIFLAGFTSTYAVVNIVCVTWPSDDDRYSSYPTRIPTCFSACDWCMEVVMWADLFQYLVAVPAVIFMSFAMMMKLKCQITIRSENIQSKKVIEKRNHVARMLIINATIFFICLTPYEIININWLWLEHQSVPLLSDNVKSHVQWIGRIAMLLNSAVNPIVYSIANPSYRRAFVQASCCYCKEMMTAKLTEYELMSRGSVVSTAMAPTIANHRLDPVYRVTLQGNTMIYM